jgi:O-antigen ligase
MLLKAACFTLSQKIKMNINFGYKTINPNISLFIISVFTYFAALYYLFFLFNRSYAIGIIILTIWMIFNFVYYSGFIKISIFITFISPILSAIYVLKPDQINYEVYTSIVIIISGFLYLAKIKKFKLDLMILYLLWFIFNSLFISRSNISITNYNLLIFPIMPLFLYILITHFDHEDVAIIFLKCILFFTFIQSVIGIAQTIFSVEFYHYNMTSFYESNRNYLSYLLPGFFTSKVCHATGTYEHFNGFSGLLSLVTPIFLGFWYVNRKNKIRFLLLIIVMLGLIFSFSRGALLGGIIGFLFFYNSVKNSNKMKTVFFLVLISIVVFFVFDKISIYYQKTENFNIRIKTWEFASVHAFQNLFDFMFGRGYKYLFTGLLSKKGVLSNLHSGQLQILFELGFLGLMLFLTYFYILFQLVLQKYKNDLLLLSIISGILSFFTSQLFDNSLFGFNGAMMIALSGVVMFIMKNKTEKLYLWWYGNDKREISTKCLRANSQ